MYSHSDQHAEKQEYAGHKNHRSMTPPIAVLLDYDTEDEFFKWSAFKYLNDPFSL